MAATPFKELNKRASMFALLLVGINLGMMFMHCPAWIIVICSLSLGWRFAYEIWSLPLPGKIVRNVIYLAGFGLIFTIQRSVFGIEAGLNSLVVAAGLKLLEVQTYRDFMSMFMICFLLLMGKLLYSQTFLMTIVLAIDIIAITGFMYRLHSADMRRISISKSLIPGLRLMAIAAPAMAFMFFFFPRVQMRFIPNPIKKATSVGFSDKLDPGNVSELAISEELAFRAAFGAFEKPGPSQLYWRGAVLGNSQGMSWYKSTIYETRTPRPRLNSDVPTFQQTIIIEPRFNQWLFALDLPYNISFQDSQLHRTLQRAPGGTFALENPLHKQAVYRAESTISMEPSQLTPNERNRYLRVSANVDENVNKLVAGMREKAQDAEEFSELVLKFFRQGKFSYTLRPGELTSTNPLSEFLFRKKRGFCEHYAAAFGTLSRLAGFPARIVVGFHGGEFNPYDGMYKITSKDAHAWNEIWSDKRQQWLRVDPTSVVAPARLELGGQEFFRLDQAASERGETVINVNSERGMIGRFISQASLLGDALTSRWDLFLLNYDFEFQARVLEKLGIKNVRPADLFAAVVIVTFLFTFIIVVRNQVRLGKKDPMRVIFRRFRNFVAKRGVKQHAGEGLIAFIDRSAQHLPDKSAEIVQFGEVFARARYGHGSPHVNSSQDLRELHDRLRAITQARRSS